MYSLNPPAANQNAADTGSADVARADPVLGKFMSGESAAIDGVGAAAAVVAEPES